MLITTMTDFSVGSHADGDLTCYMGAEHDVNAVEILEVSCQYNYTHLLQVINAQQNTTQTFNVTHG